MPNQAREDESQKRGRSLSSSNVASSLPTRTPGELSIGPATCSPQGDSALLHMQQRRKPCVDSSTQVSPTPRVGHLTLLCLHPSYPITRHTRTGRVVNKLAGIDRPRKARDVALTRARLVRESLSLAHRQIVQGLKLCRVFSGGDAARGAIERPAESSNIKELA